MLVNGMPFGHNKDFCTLVHKYVIRLYFAVTISQIYFHYESILQFFCSCTISYASLQLAV